MEINEQIAECIKTELLKRGIIVTYVTCAEKKYGLLFATSDFYTTPVLFKRTYASAITELSKPNENGIVQAYVSVFIKYELFNDEGGNEFRLFRMTCGINTKLGDVWVQETK